jgi:uncharacterized phage infection (PIP) family protein YhgE
MKLGGFGNGIHDNSTNLLDNIRNVSDFIKDTHNEGIWYAFTGEHFKTSLIQFGKDMLNMIVQCSDSLLIVALVLVIGVISGSKFCRKWLWYTSVLFLILKCLGVYSL